MTDNRDIDEANALAAEYACGLLEGAELERARERVRSDPAFARDVARWQGRLAPMLDEVADVSPPAALWGRIGARLGGEGPANDDLPALRRSLALWRGAAAGMTAIAASLALVLLLQPRPPQAPIPAPISKPRAAAPLVALVGDKNAAKVMISWNPTARQLVYVVAGELPGGPSKSHELWVIPAGGKPRSLGTLSVARQSHKELADALATLLQRGATIAISVEPQGGSPTGQPTGPVIASGSLSPA